VNSIKKLRIFLLMIGIGIGLTLRSEQSLAQTPPAPIMVVAPHPDDEGLIASGVIYRQLQAGGRVKVVIMTNGDMQGKAKGLQREGESVAALGVLGVDPQDIIFFGYPDTHMDDILTATSDTQVFTSFDGTVNATYGNTGFGGKDWHSLLFGAPGPYNRQSVMADLKSVIEAFRPSDIYTTAEIDVHADHHATYLFIHNALTQIVQELPTYQPIVHKTVVHDSAGPDAWPLPTTASGVSNRFDPTQAFTLPAVAQGSPENNLVLERLPVPTPMLSTNSANNLKFQMLNQYVSQVTPFLFAFCKKDEFFWIDGTVVPPPPPPTGGATNVAMNATVTASSQNTGTGQTAAKAIDGIIDGYPNDYTKEWATVGGGPGSWLKLAWPSAVTVNKIVLFDRPNLSDQVLTGTISFSDGSTLPVGALNNDGSATTLNFTAKTITGLTFTINSVSNSTSNIGLAEIQVFNIAQGTSSVTSGEAVRSMNRTRVAVGSATAAVSTTNTPPAIAAGPTANPQPVAIGATTALSVTATDANSDPLTYIWVTGNGKITGSGPTISYSNTVAGSFRVLVIVLDSKGSTIGGEITVTVANTSNSAPVIASEPTSSPNELAAGGTSTLTVVASDPNNDPLTYLWSATDGTVTGNGPSVSYKAPNTTIDEIVKVTVTISDGRGGTITDNVVILVRAVNHPPVITGKLTAVPSTISSAQTSSLTVTASDPDNDTLTFAWSATAGTIVGSGNTAKFTPPAPKASRNVVVTVTVSDGKGGVVTSSASIIVTK